MNALVIWLNIGTNDCWYNNVTDSSSTSASVTGAAIATRINTLVTNIWAAVPASLRPVTSIIVECVGAMDTVTHASAKFAPGDVAQALNLSIKANAYRYRFVVSPPLSCNPSANLDTTYFQAADLVHFTQTGKTYRTAYMGYYLSACQGENMSKNNGAGMTWNMRQAALKAGKRAPVGMGKTIPRKVPRVPKPTPRRNN